MASALPSKQQGAKRWKRTPLFEAWVIVDGVRRKARHTELREAYRLWAAHKDIRLGRWTGR